MKSKIGLCFYINGEEYIYEGTLIEKTNAYQCSCCGRTIKGEKIHLFNSSEGYNDGSYESQFYGSVCVKEIIKAGYKKGVTC